jgi:hypothetical protein
MIAFYFVVLLAIHLGAWFLGAHSKKLEHINEDIDEIRSMLNRHSIAISDVLDAQKETNNDI